MKGIFNKKQKKEPMEIDITSLLDILVILLVFLLKSYNPTNLKLNLAKNLEMAPSFTRALGEHAIIVQVDNNRNIFVNNKKVANTSDSTSTIQPLLESLNEAKTKEKNKEKTRRVNLVFDKKLEYKEISKVMHTTAMAGLSDFKFIVKGEY